MDLSTILKIKITGKTEEVKRAALASQRRIALDTRGFEESAYFFGDGSDFKVKMDKAIFWVTTNSMNMETETPNIAQNKRAMGAQKRMILRI